MTVSVPANEKTGAAALQSQITTLSTRTDPQSQQLLNQRQIDLVNSLLDQKKLNAATIIAGISVPASRQTNALYAAITAQNTLITSLGTTLPVYAAQQRLDQLQQQLVREEMASGRNYTAATILANFSYIGAAAQ